MTRTIRRWRWLPLFAALAAAGCTDLLQGGYRYGTLSVRVADEDGTPLPGVSVDLYNRVGPLAYGVTSPAGVHDFRFVPHGDVAVRAFPPPGYRVPEGGVSHFDGMRVRQSERVEVEFVFERDDADP